jgi:2-dehydro-3-deoxyphosphogluconate aldolase/(4S)-4-hydroxy-2-oxoglutarate aldolase
MNVIEQVRAERIIAIVRGDYSLDAVRVMAQALLDGGIKVIEVTMNSAGVLDAIRMLHAEFGEKLSIGAGTVTQVQQVTQVVEAGARFIVAPETFPDVIRASLDCNAIPIPGALTPSEVMQAYRAGARLIKLFPASFGGPDYIKAIRAPLDMVDFVATGGVDGTNIVEYLAAGAVAVGLGASLVPKHFDGSVAAAQELTRRGRALIAVLPAHK